jgi:hypothetical protein
MKKQKRTNDSSIQFQSDPKLFSFTSSLSILLIIKNTQNSIKIKEKHNSNNKYKIKKKNNILLY